MKLLNTLLTVLLITLIPSLGWSTPFDDLVERDGVYYPKFSDVPFTGEVTGKSQGSLKNGKKDGDWVIYHDNGQLKSRGNYKNGKNDGDWVRYYDDGQLRGKDNYKNGELEGTSFSYFDNGQLWYSGTYKNGKKNGDWLYYFGNGQLWNKGRYINGKKEGIWDSSNFFGQPTDESGTYKNGVKISD